MTTPHMNIIDDSHIEGWNRLSKILLAGWARATESNVLKRVGIHTSNKA